ncbi:peroxide stress protein YaaA [Lewinella sp. JB7]|uniref:peroxide stress protein YaaA n=1 Tax=Lewinella sp. JB7 TaxID=2962887 RepID=UPI0020C9F00A|nr:peroxide stress protein YaaA [Lewinella sp. JB7]MCP9237325.1 peroxide stress protein YaaA [Lewinella sp. JB7]
MLILLSPAKTLDMSPVELESTQPRLLDESETLVRSLRRKSRRALKELMSISDKLAEENQQRYHAFARPFTAENAKPAGLAFSGDVYLGLRAGDFSPREFDFANRQIRILSGLYGLLRPRDLMQPYRLEMSTRLPTRRGKDLYAFWGTRITDLLNQDLADDSSKTVLNLASKEYFQSLQPARIQGRIVDIQFKELRNGTYKFVTFNAKKARGAMARLITLEGITEAEPLKDLNVDGYRYNEAMSTPDNWMYTRD